MKICIPGAQSNLLSSMKTDSIPGGGNDLNKAAKQWLGVDKNMTVSLQQSEAYHNLAFDDGG